MTDWVQLGDTTMRGARNARGLSYEAMGRALNVSSKTYERWEKAGRVPRDLVTKYAEIVDLEIEQPARRRITIQEEPGLAEEMQALREQLARLLARLDSQDAAREPAATPRDRKVDP